MNKIIKSTNDFLHDIIGPIEQNQVDTGNLFVLINSSPELDLRSSDYQRYESYNNNGWAIPSKDIESEWRLSQYPDDENVGYFSLVTLSKIVWRGSSGGNLYQAEYSGKAINLTHHDVVHYTSATKDLQEFHKNTIKAEEYIDSCINLGVKTKKARLTSHVKNWTPFLLWSFAINCVERQYAYLKERRELPDIYKKSLVYAKANIKYLCGMGLSQMEDLISVEPTDQKAFYNETIKLRVELKNILIPMIEDDYSLSLKYFGKAVLSCIDGEIFYPFTITSLARSQHAINLFKEYSEEYNIPPVIVIDNNEKDRISKRIWYALMKQELDWQVQHLRELFGV